MKQFIEVIEYLNPVLTGLLCYLSLFLCLPDRKQRILMALIAFDIWLLSVITLGTSKRNETMSSCLWTMDLNGRLIGRALRPVVDFLASPLEANHCFTSWLVENKTELWSPKYE